MSGSSRDSSSRDAGGAGTPPRDAAGKTPGRADFSKVRGSAESSPPAPDTGAKADFSKVRGSVESTGEPAGERAHTVVKGDNLSGIAKRHYGNARHWKALFEANRDQLDDPDLIQPGQVLRIPPLQDG